MSENKTVIIDEIPSLAGGWVRVGFTSQAVYIETITKINELVKDYPSTMQPTKSDLQVAMSNAETAKTIDVFDNADDVISSMRNKAKENALLKLSDYEKDLLGLNPVNAIADMENKTQHTFKKNSNDLKLATGHYRDSNYWYVRKSVYTGFNTGIPFPIYENNKILKKVCDGTPFKIVNILVNDPEVHIELIKPLDSDDTESAYLSKTNFLEYYEEHIPF